MTTCKGILKTAIVTAAMAATAIAVNGQEKYGKTLNLGVGVGYFNYIGRPVPFFAANFEFDVARQFTLAPFIGFTSYRSKNYWENSGHNNKYYYHESVVPIGLKGTYYFDRILGANSKWDFYLAASAGIAIHSVTWDDGYNGNRDVYRGSTQRYLDLHIGAEYHFAKRAGIFADLSTGVSTIGLAIHGR